MAYDFTIDKKTDTTTGTVEVPKYTMNDIYRFTLEEQASYPTHLQHQWEDECAKSVDRMKAWEIGYDLSHYTPLDREAYMRKINEQLNLLTDQDPQLIISKIYHDGYMDYPMFAKYLMSTYPYPDKQRTITAIMASLEFLISQRDNLEEQLPSSIMTERPPLPEDDDSVMLYEQLKSLDIFLSETPNYDLLYTLKDVHHARSYDWVKNNTQFGKKLQPILGIREETIIQGLNRASRELKIEGYKYEYRPLSSLEEKHINLPSDGAKALACKKWKWYHARIKEIVS